MSAGDCGRTGGQDPASGTDCSEVLHRVYEYLDGEMTVDDTEKIKQHLDECGPCLKEYDLDQALKALVKRSCECEEAPVELRSQIVARITTLRYQISE
ncbi:mycothiol system anti-sigma-R factor [Phycicoccus sp. 3266]|uniref:mycothiol system anti-sigma-R factor n=1 Tax=Phycicoccus sp. 3266 TaxID=2817751 RepID=UPI0028616ED5|nr:mycothiol system anti-sigma-R factor [Phycicoccus sp. 3266]MDR6864123.1 anti-sigma factor (TIGR02949 family) [Phycicoccus sp. 3266]